MITQADRIFVESADRITKHENNLVDLTLASGEKIVALEPRRLFPVSNPDTYITLLDKDGTERAVIRSMEVLDPDSRLVVSESLSDYYLVPEILRIISVTEKYGTVRFTVETDSGIKQFDLRNRNHDIKLLHDRYIRVRDSNDNRYIIPDYAKLDRKSLSFISADI